MKYFVRVGDQEVVVEIDGDQVRVNDRLVAARLDAVSGTPVVRLRLDGESHDLAVAGRVDGSWQLIDCGTVREIAAVDERTRHIQSLAGAGAAEVSGGVVKAPMPGLVVRVLVTVGETVVPGQGLVVLEAMKMENELKAPAAGQVHAVHASPGAAVEKGSVLVEIGPSR
jgi:biotin carboxyl carrier protein